MIKLGQTKVEQNAEINNSIVGLSVNGRTITYTRGNGKTGTLLTQDKDTTYDVFSGSDPLKAGTIGLVPAPTTAEYNSYLRGDGRWVEASSLNTHYTAYLYAGGSTGGSNAATSNGGTYLKLVENGAVRSAKLIKGTGATTVTSDSSGNITINTPSNAAITEISSSVIRITDLVTGIYKLTYAGTKSIYYNGTSSTSSVTVYASTGAVMLIVNRYSATYWTWHYINSYGSSTMYICYGYTTASAGGYRNIGLPSVTSGTLATTVAATTSAAGLMSAADKTKLNNLGAWTIKSVYSDYWRLSSSSSLGMTKGTIMMLYNANLKLCLLKGVLNFSGTDETIVNNVSIQQLKSLLGFPSISSSYSGYDDVGTCIFGNNSDFNAERNGYGGYVRLNDTKAYLRFGRIYTTTNSHGDWGYRALGGEGLSFNAMFTTA